MRYTKLFSSIIHSSIWQEDKATKVVWITMLAMSNWHGEVEGSILGLANAAGVSPDECVAVLDILKAPDKWSRSQEFEGRRIEDIEGGWHILNYVTYREKLSEEHRLEKQRERSRRYRDRQKESERVTLGVTHSNEKTPHIDLDLDLDLDSDKKKTKKVAYSRDFEQFWAIYPKKKQKGAAFKAWKSAHKRGVPDIDELTKILKRNIESPEWTSNKGQYIQYPATWLNADGWEDEITTADNPNKVNYER